MSFGTITLRPSRSSTDEWVETRAVQVMFSPTYLGVLAGLPTEENLEARLRRQAESLWGERENLQVLMGHGVPRKDLTPEDIKELQEMDLGYLQFPPTAIFVELVGKVIDPHDSYDINSNAWLVMLGPRPDLGVGLDRVIQRFVDSYELVWDEIAVNTAP